ncbi:MAG: SCP2 sterol-binding domain-containing protein [Desulfobacterales bacterium]|jgi:hypothetical protein
MIYDIIKANLNLTAVLQNLEDLVQFDDDMAALTKHWDTSLQFTVFRGPKAFVRFKNGRCRVQQGNHSNPSLKLFFFSPAHLNRMFAGNGTPIPLKGFTKLKFLIKEFSKLTDKLEYYLTPSDKRLQVTKYLELNTRFTLNTAVFAVKELVRLDPIAKTVASHIGNGRMLIKIMPHGPSIHLDFQNGDVFVKKGDTVRPMACIFMQNVRVANDFLNGKLDAFTAIASGNVLIKGQIPMIDSISLILDRIPLYLK